MEVRLPPDKLTYLCELTSVWVTRRRATRWDLEELTGFLQFASQVIPLARAFICTLYDFAATFPPSPFSCRHISRAARLDIEWWHTVAPLWNGVRFLSDLRPTIDVYTDASGSKGLSGHLGKEWFSARCPRCLHRRHIQVKEIFAVLFAILCWGEQFRGTHVVFHVDNDAVFNAIRSKTIKSADTMKLVQHLVALACQLDFSFSSEWLPSSENSIADTASHFAYSRMFSIGPWLNQKPSSKHLQLGGTSKTATTLKPSHFTYGTVWRPAHAARTTPDNGNLFSMLNSTTYTTPTGPFCPHQNQQSCPGSQALAAASSPRPSKLTCWPCAPSTLMPTSRSQQLSPLSSNASSGALKGTTGNATTTRSNQSPSPCSRPSSPSSSPAPPPATP